MSGILKTIKKNVEKRQLKYERDMYSTVYGSLTICCLMFTPEENKPAVNVINKTWRNLRKKCLNNESSFPSIADEDFIVKCLDLFGLKVPEYFPIAIVKSNFNMLFAPYIDGHILPIREDGFMSRTLESGKVYPIDFNAQETNKDAAV